MMIVACWHGYEVISKQEKNKALVAQSENYCIEGVFSDAEEVTWSGFRLGRVNTKNAPENDPERPHLL